jgi:hypothetical protein
LFQKQEYPPHITKNDKKTLWRLSLNLFLNGEVLYKRNYDMTLLRCVDASEVEQILKEVHEGVCGTHAHGHMLSKKILRAGYY